MSVRFRAPAGVAAVLVFAALGACSLAIDLDPLSNGACPMGTKACSDECVSETNPDFGCASVGCAPCTIPHANAICAPAGTCALASCIGSYFNCDGDPANGCETDLDHDPDHCGSCTANPCVTQNGTPGCSAGHCTTLECNTGFGDCNDLPTDGCETNLNMDPMNCGECQTMCTSGQTCQSGKCL